MSTEFINDQWRLPNAWNGTESNVNKQSNYSMSFDGSNQYINLGNSTQVQPVKEMSISAWINASSLATYRGIVSCTYQGSSYDGFALRLDDTSSNKIQFVVNSLTQIKSTSTITTGQWYHLVATYDGANIKLYFNGSLESSTSLTGNIDYSDGSRNTIIGSLYPNVFEFTGKIDAVAIFDYALSSSQVTTLYGSSSTGIGNPMSLSPKPVASYNLGDKSAFNSANYLVPNIAAQEADGDIAVSYSPYALDFDGVNDYIDCGDSDDFSFGNGTTDSEFTFSVWINADNYPSGSICILGKDQTNNNREYVLGVWNAKVKIFIKSQGGNNQQSIDSTTSLSANQWYHIAATYDGRGGSNAADGLTIYINGIAETPTNITKQSYTFMSNTTSYFAIGQYFNAAFFNGKISNVSIWNAALTSAQVTEIYSEGIPQNLLNHSAVSSLVSWWQLGSNSSFNTNWTVLDEKGSNNGTSVNMTEDDIVDGVGSYANGLSSGMGGDEVIGDAPYSTANSLSVNMDVEDRVTDTPS